MMPGLCTDTCNKAYGRRLQRSTGIGIRGKCDDGIGTNAITRKCLPGTDCSDCGLRHICSSCPPECAALIRRGIFCLEEMWSSEDTCYPGCNHRQCAHHGCTTEEARTACLATLTDGSSGLGATSAADDGKGDGDDGNEDGEDGAEEEEITLAELKKVPALWENATLTSRSTARTGATTLVGLTLDLGQFGATHATAHAASASRSCPALYPADRRACDG